MSSELHATASPTAREGKMIVFVGLMLALALASKSCL
jgi:hypothetical protein